MPIIICGKTQKKTTMKRKDSGFSMIELLVVIGILGILAAIAIPQINSYKNKGFLARAQSDLRHFATAQEAYFVDHQVYKSCSNQACVSLLPGVNSLSPGITLTITATATGFTMQTDHPQLPATCQWNSSQEGFLGCT